MIATDQTFCKQYGHLWRIYGQRGIYRCQHCQTCAYCPRCLFVHPKGMKHIILCRKHKETMMSTPRNYARPAPPDMQGGQPTITTPRRSLYTRQRDTEEKDTQPITTSPRRRFHFRLGKSGWLITLCLLFFLGLILFIQEMALPWWNNSIVNQWQLHPMTRIHHRKSRLYWLA
jgi:hypothetical protein